MGDQVCEIEEIGEEAAMATVREEHRKVNYNQPDFSDAGPHISNGDVSPRLGWLPYFTHFLQFLFFCFTSRCLSH